MELDAKAAPEAAALFLKVALDGGYYSERFQRGDSKERDSGFVSAGMNPVWLDRSAKRLKLEEVSASNAPPADGTIAADVVKNCWPRLPAPTRQKRVSIFAA